MQNDIRTLFALVLGLASSTTLANGAETDDYYSWTRPLPDSTHALNAAVGVKLDAALAAVNRGGRDLSCEEAAQEISAQILPLDYTEVRFAPASNTERREREAPISIYRDVPALLPTRGLGYDLARAFGPVSLARRVQINGVNHGEDKITVFFASGWRGYARYLELREKGWRARGAFKNALRHRTEIEGNAWSDGWGVFSYADLEAATQGMEFFRSMCGGDAPNLTRANAAWRFARPFDARDWVSPCWDESWRPSIYSDIAWRYIEPALRETYCPELSRGVVQARRSAYRARGCDSSAHALLEDLRRARELPDPSRFDIEAVCATP
jgi:hypothetical protein